MGNSNTNMRKVAPLQVMPHSKAWAWAFEKADGRYLRGSRCLDALRNRSRAYRLQGMRSDLCAEAAVTDLAGLMDDQEGKKVERP